MTKTPHDALFKSVFQQPENAAAELQHVLSDEHVLAFVAHDLQLEQFRAMLKGRAPVAESVTMTIAEQLLAEGEARGKAQGELRRAAASVLTVLEARGLNVPPDARQRVEDCRELEVLQHWLVQAVTVARVDEVFEA